jgi:threonine dehydrogenase-like Zn-dependent dehydrogenase
MGAGPIGLGVVQFARLAGAEVIVMDVNEYRLSYCEKRLGVRHIINATDRNVCGQLTDITGGDMATVVIDATGNQKAINNGINYLAHGGRYILIGLQKDEIVISHPEFHKRESTLMSSRNATRRDFDQVIDAIRNKMIDPTSYVSRKVNFSEVGNEFANWLNPSNGLIKTAVEMD